MLIALFNMELLSLNLAEKAYKLSFLYVVWKMRAMITQSISMGFGSKDHVTFYGLQDASFYFNLMRN